MSLEIYQERSVASLKERRKLRKKRAAQSIGIILSGVVVAGAFGVRGLVPLGEFFERDAVTSGSLGPSSEWLAGEAIGSYCSENRPNVRIIIRANYETLGPDIMILPQDPDKPSHVGQVDQTAYCVARVLGHIEDKELSIHEQELQSALKGHDMSVLPK